jgi:XTP/dITP diphosphohydrolase
LKLIFATNNQHKVDEILYVVGNAFEIITLKTAGINVDIPEPYDTLEENASGKSRAIFEMTGMNCFGEDTGLEVNALNGEPGVKSARYAGEGRSFDKNIEKLLINLAGKTDRSARFRTVISLLIDGKETLFQGICEGSIIQEKRGGEGFGYDPVFIPSGADKTFAEMDLEEKNIYSHRSKATEKLVAFLNSLKQKSEN